ncbi:SigE family RNA polymerase sigma factor [Nocardioides sp. URHA0032]|uniref:SigE family RNA polymerase sigma factor n=1 Tax=Nocardioides sp. URHA0032 TaxID=1380388 RepID=UPI00048A9800|nr:SigE family RNA polymerase sigma factor [Nocardioides sp. URHA0032]
MGRSRHLDTEFAEFVAARSPQLYRSAYLLTTSSHAAEDLVQTALAKAYAAWWRVRSADDPVAYVHGVLVKSFLSDRRRRSSTELPTADLPDRVTTDTDPAERLALLSALAKLAPLDRAVVVLRFWEDHSVADTAAELDLSEAAVKNRSLRALRALRGLLTEPQTNGSTR